MTTIGTTQHIRVFSNRVQPLSRQVQAQQKTTTPTGKPSVKVHNSNNVQPVRQQQVVPKLERQLQASEARFTQNLRSEKVKFNQKQMAAKAAFYRKQQQQLSKARAKAISIVV